MKVLLSHVEGKLYNCKMNDARLAKASINNVVLPYPGCPYKKLGTFTGQYEHTQRTTTEHVYPAHSISLRFKFSSKFGGCSELSANLTDVARQ